MAPRAFFQHQSSRQTAPSPAFPLIPATLFFTLTTLFTYTDVFSVLILNPLRKKLRRILPPSLTSGLLSSLLAVRWTSNIPGNPCSMDSLSTIIAGPFPSLVDYNACLPGLKLPVILEGRAPQGCRYWSIQVSLKGAANVTDSRDGASETAKERKSQCLLDAEIKIDQDGYYRVCIGGEETIGKSDCANFINAGTSTTGLLVIRCFKMREGTAWRAPDLLCPISRQVVPAKFQVRECGPFSSITGPTSPFVRLRTTVGVLCGGAVAFPGLVKEIGLGAVLAMGLHRAVVSRFAAKYKLHKLPPAGGVLVNSSVVKIPGLGGNADHTYFSINYDCSREDLEITGMLAAKVGRGGHGAAGFRYMNLTCYNYNGLPLRQFLDDESMAADKGVAATQANAVVVTERFTAYLTTERTFQSGVNEIDVSEAVVGCATLRVLLAVSDEVVDICEPTVRVVERGFRR